MPRTLFFLHRYIIVLMLFVSSAAAIGDADSISFTSGFFEDVGGSTSFEEILSPQGQKRFQKPDENGLSFGWVNNPYWVKIDIAPYTTKETLLLEIPWPLLDELNVYIVDTENSLIKRYELGDHKVFSKRPIFDSHFVIPIDFGASPIGAIYFKATTTSSMQLPLEFWSQQDYFKHRAIYLTVQGIFYGLLLVMIFYNLFIYFSIRRIAYLHYVCFVASFGTLQAGLKGTGFQFLWPNSTFLNDYAIATGGGFSLLFLTLFARSFLQLSEAPLLKKINNYMLFTASLFIIASLILPYRTVITPLTIVVLICSFTVIGKAIYRYRQGFREARFYLMAWIAMVSGCFVYLFKQLGLFPINFFTENSMQIGSALEVILLSFALADRLNTLKKGLESANQKLEQEVEDRTQALVSALDKLGKANSKLAVISTTDGLTGLRNRYHFDASLDKEIGRIKRNQTTVCLLLLDLDHFKKINDHWGHQVGDNALQFVSEQLSLECRRQTDTICRYGGEEFAIILSETRLEGASKVAEKICRRIEKSQFSEGDTRIPLTISIGVSASSMIDGLDADLLIKAADTALYNAKADGRNCVHTFQGRLKKDGDPSLEKTQRFA